MANKRMNGEGSIRLRKDGRWECRLTAGRREEDGKPLVISLYGKTQGEVKRKLAEYRKRQLSGIDMCARYTFCQWADIWYDNHTEIAESTKEGYKYTLRILKNHFGSWKLEEIKAMDVEIFLKKLRSEGRSQSGIAQCRGMLFQILQKAVSNDLLIKNPVVFASTVRSCKPVKEKEAFTAREVKLLMACLPQNLTGLSIRLMLGTGMRAQEMLALQPEHIAEDGSVIYIRQAVVHVRGGIAIGPPKSRDSYRDIPVPPGLQWAARRLRQTQKRFIWEMGVPNQPCNPSYFRKLFREALASVEGVRVLTPHCCRHTYVSQMQGLGVDLETIQSIVGHAEAGMTRHYLHVQNPIRQAAVTRFSDFFLATETDAPDA